MRSRPRREDPRERIRHLIALDATNVVRRLGAHIEEMVALFSRLRNRQPMLETIQSGFGTLASSDLAQLPRREQSAVNAFYESLGELRWYLQYTEDMPGTVRKTALQHRRRLEHAFTKLIDALGSPAPDGAPVVDGDLVRVEPDAPKALASGADRGNR